MRRNTFFTLALLLIACEERIDPVSKSRDTAQLVVESVFTNERKNQLVKLSLTHAEFNGEPQPATGAWVYVFEDTIAFELMESPPGSGNYYTQTGRAVSGKKYTLIIQYQGVQYFGQDSAVPVQPLTPLRVLNSDNGYSLVLDQTGDDPYYEEYLIDWQNTEACGSGESCNARVVFYDLKTIDVNEIYKPDKSPFYFPKGSVVIRNKYSVSPAYRDFLRSMLSETEWRGSLFDVERSNVSTNLSKGAIGFFAVCSVVSDTTVVQ